MRIAEFGMRNGDPGAQQGQGGAMRVAECEMRNSDMKARVRV
jgi:hypothetical protein